MITRYVQELFSRLVKILLAGYRTSSIAFYLVPFQCREDYLRYHREKSKRFRTQNPSYHAKYRRERIARDPEFRTLCLLRTRTSNFISRFRKSNSRSSKTRRLLGCSVIKFREYIGELFKPGMNWDNHGKIWHLDHRIPCSKFDLSNEFHQRVCFHYSNYQPLFASDNISKGNKLNRIS